ncbi:MAG: PINc/VapC family ATPase [Candidatus Aenigmatarchaeota archaeon]
MPKTAERVVPDTSVLISGLFTDLISKGEVRGEIIIPEFVVEELRAQASRGREIGFKGLEELKKIRVLAEEGKISLRKAGRRQTYEEIKLARYGRIDALILDVAREEGATIFTSDLVQSLVAEAEGVAVKYYKPYELEKAIRVEQLLTPDTMSLHLKENTRPYAKRGKPGERRIVYLSEQKMSAEELEAMVKEILDAARYVEEAFVEYDVHGASVIQLKNMRIAITRPPLSDGLEVTIVRPTVKLRLEDYKLSDRLKRRIAERMEGLLIAGPPGSGKSTFAASIAEFLLKERQATVKTLESPRDLQVPPEVTQYGPLEGSFAKTADILLLVRPDYTVFDEVRKTSDFQVYSDMRLAGIGMIGVVHASDPIDAVQRFIGRVELGLIPHIIDTIIFIRGGVIEKVYELGLVVRVPTGMTEADLARPVVEVRNLETGELEFEIYSYGEENVIIPVAGVAKESPVAALARKQILAEVQKYDRHAQVELAGERATIKVSNEAIPRIIGREGRTIKELEAKLGVAIDVVPRVPSLGRNVPFEHSESGAYLVFELPKNLIGKMAHFYVDDRLIFSATIGKKGQVRVDKDSDIGRAVLSALIKGAMKVFV